MASLRDSLEEDVDGAEAVHGRRSPQAGHLDRRGHREARRGRRAAVRRCRRPALRRGCRKARGACSGDKLDALTLQAARGAEEGGRRRRSRTGARRARSAGCGPRDAIAVDRERTKPTGSAGSTSSTRSCEACRACTNSPTRSSAPGFRDVLLLGMGGSSLGPEVLAETLRHRSPAIRKLHVLDSTDPAQIRSVRSNASISARTLFIVSSKSGSTLEPNVFKDYFFERAKQTRRRSGSAGAHFVAITDPGSSLEKVARRATASATCSTGCRASAGAIRCCRISAWCRRRRSASTCRRFLEARREMVRSCGAERAAGAKSRR